MLAESRYFTDDGRANIPSGEEIVTLNIYVWVRGDDQQLSRQLRAFFRDHSILPWCAR